MALTALELYQDFLDEMAKARLARDADRFCARIFLPHRIETETSTVTLQDEETSRRHFHGFADALRAQGVDQYIRTARHAQFDNAEMTQISGYHESFVLSGGKLVVPKFANEASLVLRDGVWGATRICHLVRYVSWPDILPRVGGEAT